MASVSRPTSVYFCRRGGLTALLLCCFFAAGVLLCGFSPRTKRDPNSRSSRFQQTQRSLTSGVSQGDAGVGLMPIPVCAGPAIADFDVRFTASPIVSPGLLNTYEALVAGRTLARAPPLFPSA